LGRKFSFFSERNNCHVALLQVLGRERQRRREGGDEPSTSPGKLPGPTDHVFPGNHVKLSNGVLARTKLKFDRDGNRRTAYSLRHTYICMRLMEGADIYQIAKNCRTSVEMIGKSYASQEHARRGVDQCPSAKAGPARNPTEASAGRRGRRNGLAACFWAVGPYPFFRDV
jgi:hypothetical protein